MTRAAAMTAVSSLCLLWMAGCASTDGSSKQAATTPAAPTDVSRAGTASDALADAMPDPHADIATLSKTLPSTLDGEIRRAQLLRAKGDYDEAARSLAQLLLVAPDDGRIVGEYGKVLEQQGNSREALPFLKRAAELAPNEWSVQSALGVAYDQLDDHTSARTAYERALALKPGDSSVLNNYAVSRMLAGDYVGAKRLFAQAAANGGPNSKIAGNLEKLAALAPQPAPAPAPVPAAPVAPRTVAMPPAPASASPVAAKANVSVAAMPQVSHAVAPQLPGASASVVAKTGHAAPAVRVAVAGPKALGAQVVMQPVPHDPMAGPVHPAAPKPASTARKPQAPAKKTPPEPPSLRTAADSN